MHAGDVGKVARLGVRQGILAGEVTQSVALERKLVEKGGVTVQWEDVGT